MKALKCITLKNSVVEIISFNNLADLLGVSRATIEKWVAKGRFKVEIGSDGKKYFEVSKLQELPAIQAMMTSSWIEEKEVVPSRDFTSIELFAGGGGLALGLEKAGFHNVLLNEFDHDACDTLRQNRPSWNVVEGDIHELDFTPYRNKVDFLSGGFPCQAFSYAGKRLGFEETRGTLF